MRAVPNVLRPFWARIAALPRAHCQERTYKEVIFGSGCRRDDARESHAEQGSRASVGRRPSQWCALFLDHLLVMHHMALEVLLPRTAALLFLTRGLGTVNKHTIMDVVNKIPRTFIRCRIQLRYSYALHCLSQNGDTFPLREKRACGIGHRRCVGRTGRFLLPAE